MRETLTTKLQRWKRVTLPADVQWLLYHRGVNNAIQGKIPCVNHRKELRHHSHESLIMSFAPSVTHGVELHAFNARKMPRSMHNRGFMTVEKIRSFASKGYSCNLQNNWLWISYTFPQASPKGHFTSNVKVPHIYRQDTLIQGKDYIICVKGKSWIFITELNLNTFTQGVTRGVLRY